jgi:hypothetical protein
MKLHRRGGHAPGILQGLARTDAARAGREIHAVIAIVLLTEPRQVRGHDARASFPAGLLLDPAQSPHRDVALRGRHSHPPRPRRGLELVVTAFRRHVLPASFSRRRDEVPAVQ